MSVTIMSPDVLSQCVNAGSIFYVGALCGALIGALAAFWMLRE